MAILQGDIRLLKSDTMNDAPEGGGAITGQTVVDGLSNNIFDDISTLDRVYGAVHLRKVFPAINTQTVDKYFGAHVIIVKLPGDNKIGVNLFNTGDWFDRRPDAASRVENYRAQGPTYQGFLWGTQYKGSRAVTIFQGEGAPKPGIGDVLMIVSLTGSQYIRIVKMTDSVQTFTDDQGQFKRRILEIEISDVLTRDFVGSQISRLDNLQPDAKLFKTVIANAARYYSARPLALPAANDSLTVKVDSVYSQVVPSSQSETSLVDISASGTATPVIAPGSGSTSFSTSVIFSANSSFYLGMPCAPGTLRIAIGGTTLVDDGGDIKSGAVTVGTISYATGIITFSANSPTYGGSKTVTYRPAAAPIMLSDTASIRVTGANRGFVWNTNLYPGPEPLGLRVAYRALDKWYEMADNGKGGVVGTESGIGSGTINYATGDLTITTGALPDADTSIIISWAHPADFFNRANTALGKIKIKYPLLQKGFAPETVVVSWNDGSPRTATCNAAGVVSGAATGQLNLVTGLLEFSPNSLPLGGTSFAVNYNYGPAISKTITSFTKVGNQVTIDLNDTNITPGTIKIRWAAPWTAPADDAAPIPNGSILCEDRDDGNGALVGGRSATINYTNGTLSLDPTVDATYKIATWEDSPWKGLGGGTSTTSPASPVFLGEVARSSPPNPSPKWTTPMPSLQTDGG